MFAWPGDAHILLLGAGSFVALLLAFSARGLLGLIVKVNLCRDIDDWVH